ncbi:membrane protein insertase YidC 1 [Lactococcus hodotermopsidis]|uniref:Membrane protein insertase YidC n=1 Tax=Pseudolactococcus hodotermopsidis TaxID=2709157 RepID=A0A6A0BBS4_9LACT|nr:YidC/Oxa1 family membrane protein insertase [Lactococcus hodotermopsidis]GFH42840.1 membrane protein insertase YidC 1 [Lactococcus hodotermopsidis]
MKKKLKLSALASLAILVLTGCGRTDITSHTKGIWEQFVYGFAQIIRFLSFGGLVGLGIILFTILIKTVLLPLMHFQMKSTRKMQEVQPEIKKLQAQYSGKDTESRRILTEKTQELYAEHGVNQFAGCLPLLVQMPILWALYQAITRVDFLRDGHFLWFDIAGKDPYYILPILAALCTFASSWLTMKAAPEKNSVTTAMTYIMPVMIFVMGISVAAGVALYWAVSNAYQVFQTMLLNNPFKLQEERAAKAKAEKDKIKARQKAMAKAKKKK